MEKENNITTLTRDDGAIRRWDPRKTLKKQLKEYNNFAIIINGMSRSGKSYMLKDILKPVIGKFDFIVVFSKTLRAGGYDWVNSELKFDDLKPSVIRFLHEEYYSGIEEDPPKKKFRTLYIIDDCISNNIKYSEAIGELFMNGRHTQSSIAILGQKCSLFSTSWMANTTVFISLFAGSKSEKEYIAKKIISNVLPPSDKTLREEEKDAYNLQTEHCNNYKALIILPLESKLEWYRAN